MIDWEAEGEAADLEESERATLLAALKDVARAARAMALFPIGNAYNRDIYSRRKAAIERLRTELATLPEGALDDDD